MVFIKKLPENTFFTLSSDLKYKIDLQSDHSQIRMPVITK